MSARRGQAREMIANQTLGAPVSVTFTLHKPPTPPADGGPLEWRLSAADSGGGLFCDTGVHAVDIIEYVMVSTTTHFASVEKSRPEAAQTQQPVCDRCGRDPVVCGS